MITLVFPFLGMKVGFPGSNILQSSLNIACNKKQQEIETNKYHYHRHIIKYHNPAFSQKACKFLSYTKQLTTAVLQKLKLFSDSVFQIFIFNTTPHVWTQDFLIGVGYEFELNRRKSK